jgi:hypothetical protein
VSVETHADLLEAIDEKIEKINNHKAVRIAEQLMRQRDELQMARRALLGVGSKTTSSGGTRVTQRGVHQRGDGLPRGDDPRAPEPREQRTVREVRGHRPVEPARSGGGRWLRRRVSAQRSVGTRTS